MKPEELQARKPWEPENGYNGSFGLNIALLSRAGEFIRDLHGLPAEGGKEQMMKGTILRGLRKDKDDLTSEPRYRLNI